jgi:hypothetical protein
VCQGGSHWPGQMVDSQIRDRSCIMILEDNSTDPCHRHGHMIDFDLPEGYDAALRRLLYNTAGPI